MNRIKQLRLEHGLTQDDLGKMLGLQKAAICKYETGRVKPTQDAMFKLSDLFRVSVDYILGRTDFPISIDPQHTVPVPIVGRVHAGLPILAEENISDYLSVPESELRAGEYFFMEVEGDCMVDAHIIEGCHVLVHMQPSVDNGQIAVVRIEDEVVVRRVKWLQNQLILYPANPRYDPLIIASGDVQIIGRVVEIRITDV